jgi:hypothetical protein
MMAGLSNCCCCLLFQAAPQGVSFGSR